MEKIEIFEEDYSKNEWCMPQLEIIKVYLSSLGHIDALNNFLDLFTELSYETLQFNAMENMIIFTDGKNRTFKEYLDYFDRISENIYKILDERIDIDKETFYMNLIIYIELNYIILLVLIKNFHIMNNNSRRLYTPVMDDDTNIKDIYLIIEANNFLVNKLFFLTTHISDIVSKIMNKDYMLYASQFDKNLIDWRVPRLVFHNLDYMLDMIFLCLKFIFRPNNHLMAEIKINTEQFSELVIKLFQVVMDYLLINWRDERALMDKIVNSFCLEQYLIFSYIFLNYVMDKKFSVNSEFKYDFGTYFPFFYTFGSLFYNTLRTKLMVSISHYCCILDKIESFDMKKLKENYYIPPYLIHLNTENLKNFIIHHMTAWTSSENTYEFVNRNYWIMIYIDTCAFSEILERLIETVYDLLNKPKADPILEETLEFMFYQNVPNEELVCKLFTLFTNYYNERGLIVLNKKCVMIRSIFDSNYMFILRHMIDSLKIFRNVNWNNIVMITPINRMFTIFEELSHSVFKTIFFMSNQILKIINPQRETRLRIEIEIIKYFDIESITHIQKENMDVNMDGSISESFNKKLVFNISNILDKLPIDFSSKISKNITLDDSDNLLFKKSLSKNPSILADFNKDASEIKENHPSLKNIKELTDVLICKSEVDSLVSYLEQDRPSWQNEIFRYNMKYYDYKSEIDFKEDVNNLIKFLD
jgi:hypothetical protein